MKYILRCFVALILVLGATVAHAQVQYNPADWYFIATDTNPTTQVYSTKRGIFVANSDSTYKSWLALGIYGGAAAVGGTNIWLPITGVQSNGGLCEVTVADTSALSTNQVLQVNNFSSASACNGQFAITVTDGTHLTLQGSAYSGSFVATDQAYVSGPAISPTKAAIYTAMNQSAILQYASTLSYQPITIGVTTSLTLPLAVTTQVTPTADSLTIKMPQANLYNSPPIGTVYTIINGASTHALSIADSNGTAIGSGLIYAQGYMSFALTGNSSTIGTWVMVATGQNWSGGVPSGSGQIAISPSTYAYNGGFVAQPLSGDCTITALGAITCPLTNYTGTSGHKIPYLDGSNTWSGATQTFNLGGTSNMQFTATSNYNVVSLNNVVTTSGCLGIFGGASGDATELYLCAPSFVAFYMSGTEYYAATTTTFEPNADASYTLGAAGHTWSGVYATLANTATTSAVCYNTSTKLFTYDATIGTCNTSDERLKDIGPRIDNALDKLLQIDGFYFTYKDQDQYGHGQQIGVGAQTVEKVFPEVVATDSSGVKSVDYQKLVAPVIEALRELKADNDNLSACLASWRCRLFGVGR